MVVIMNSAALYKKVLIIALPASAKFFLDVLMVLIDLAMIGSIGVNELAAVGMGLLLISALLGTVDSLFASGGMIIISRLKGAGREAEANQAFFNLLFIVVPLSIAIMLIAPFVEELYLILQATPEVAVLGQDYFGVILYGCIFIFLDVMFFTYFSSVGNSKLPMNIKILTIVFNVVFNYIFIFGKFGFPALGVTGAAFGTILSTALGCLIYLYYVVVKQQYRFNCKLSTKMIKEVFTLGIPSVFENGIFQATWLFIISMITAYSTSVAAGFHIGYRVESIAFLPGLGAAVASTTLVSQFLGAQNHNDAKQAAYITGVVTSAFMGSIGLGMVLFPELFARIFTNEPQVIEDAALYIRIIGLTQIPLGLQFIYTAALRGAGAVKSTALIKIMLLWVNITLPAMLIVHMDLGVIWIFVVISFANIIDAAVFIYLFKREKWRHLSLASLE